MIIKNAFVYTEKGEFVKQDIRIKNGYFVEEEEISDKDGVSNEEDGSVQEEIMDAQGCYAIPGLTDIHFHGCMGYDFCDATKEVLRAIGEYEVRVGVTTMVPATMTLKEEALLEICKVTDEYLSHAEINMESELCGIYLEGPFVAEGKKGAQNAAYIRKPDIRLYERLQEVSGNRIKVVTIAPETEGAMDFIQEKHGEVVISLAHTMADYDNAIEAFQKGASHVTHLYNAMKPYLHREPGILAASADMGAEVELICDGVHVHPAVVRTTFKIFGDDKIIFISDSMRATGLPDGNYELGRQKVLVEGQRAMLEDGTIAGSVRNLLECMRMAVLEMGIPLESAVKCATVNPAKCIGIYDKYGSIRPGKVANVVLLDKEDLRLRDVIFRGKKV